MPPFSRRLVIVFLLTLGALAPLAMAATKSAEFLVPSTTKGFITVPSVQSIQQAWDRIALGKLAADPKVQPFIEDMREQIQTSLDRTGIRIGLQMEDLVDVCAGEVAIAFIQPELGAQKHAVAAIADITGKQDAVVALRKKVRDTMDSRDADRKVKNVNGIEIEVYTVPIKQGARKTFSAVLFQTEDRLVAVDHEEIALQILNIMQGADGEVLAKHLPYIKTMNRCTKEAKGLHPHLKWFVEPLGYAEVAREAAAIQRRRRNDVIEALSKQGFEAIRGAGGYVNLNVGDFELLHRGYVYAPAFPGAGEEKYEHAARVLAFPGSETLDVQAWVPDTISSYASATWQIQRSYQYIGSLVDEIAGAEGFFDDLKASLLEDPNGPQIDLDKDIVAHIGNRATLFTDCETPITVKSERFLVAISLTDAVAMAKGIRQVLKGDPAAEKIEVDGHEIWKIINEDIEAPVVEIEGAEGFGGFQDFGDEQGGGGGQDEDMAPLMTNAAIAVVEGHLMISSHVDFIVEIIRRAANEPNLADSEDYQAVMSALKSLGSTKQDTIRLFSRADEEFQATYELIRQGRMPESEGIFGNLLNQLFSPKEKGVVRDQKIDGEHMPEYQVVRRYLGPCGFFVQTEEDGWYTAAVGLSKDTPLAPSADATLSTAGRSSN